MAHHFFADSDIDEGLSEEFHLTAYSGLSVYK